MCKHTNPINRTLALKSQKQKPVTARKLEQLPSLIYQKDISSKLRKHFKACLKIATPIPFLGLEEAWH